VEKAYEALRAKGMEFTAPPVKQVGQGYAALKALGGRPGS
jgi:hypothetical protein